MKVYIKIVEDGMLEKYIVGGEKKELVIPDDVHSLCYDCLSPETWSGTEAFLNEIDELNLMEDWKENCQIEKIVIPENIKKIGDGAFVNLPKLLSFEVDENCVSGSVYDEALFSKDGKNLICCPCCKDGDFTIPHGTEKILYRAFENSDLSQIYLPESVTCIKEYVFFNGKMKAIFIPSSVTEIGEGAFESCPNLTLKVPKGSYAEKYAIENKIPFDITDEKIIKEKALNTKKEYWIACKKDDGTKYREERLGYRYEWNEYFLYSDYQIPEDNAPITEEKSGIGATFADFVRLVTKNPDAIKKRFSSIAPVISLPLYEELEQTKEWKIEYEHLELSEAKRTALEKKIAYLFDADRSKFLVIHPMTTHEGHRHIDTIIVKKEDETVYVSEGVSLTKLQGCPLSEVFIKAKSSSKEINDMCDNVIRDACFNTEEYSPQHECCLFHGYQYEYVFFDGYEKYHDTTGYWGLFVVPKKMTKIGGEEFLFYQLIPAYKEELIFVEENESTYYGGLCEAIVKHIPERQYIDERCEMLSKEKLEEILQEYRNSGNLK